MNDTAQQILHASATARAKAEALDKATAERLKALYQSVISQLQQELAASADAQNTVRLATLNTYLHQARQQLAALDRAQRVMLSDGVRTAAELGARPWATGIVLEQLADTAARFVENFMAADGLKLSDRLWRLSSGTLSDFQEVIRRNVVLGNDASRAALEFMAKQEALPLELRANLGKDGVNHLAGVVEQRLLSGPGNAYNNALRIFRTEINRAHGEAYQLGAGAHPEVVGMRFMLSPNHPRPDICDSLAEQDNGMGPGVYKIGAAPWPAHPNTMSFLVAVFKSEIKTRRPPA